MQGHLRTAAGVEIDLAVATERDHSDLYTEFSRIVDAGEGHPQVPGPLPYAEFSEYWLERKSVVVVARHRGRLAGSYFLKPNFPGRAAHIANAGYFVVRELRSRGVGTALIQHSMITAREMAFDAMQFNLVLESNPSRRLYERLGFRVVGRIPEAVNGEAAMVYWRRI